jgi:hypothetical protein
MDIEKFQELGHTQIKLTLPENLKKLILEENYNALDKCLGDLLKEDGLIYQALLPFGTIKKTEYLIAIREEGSDEDGIWHDDGSRDLAFTLSLVLDLQQLKGGILLFREKNNHSNLQRISTPTYGTLTVIKTGKDNYEHRVEKVTSGKRIICAGWIN